MLDFPEETKGEPKCLVTHGTMGVVNPKEPPVKRKPFAAILSHPFVSKVDLVLPEEVYEIVKSDLMKSLEPMRPVYSRVILPLSALLEGDFFNEYIKKGNILMLSEGNMSVDNVYKLRDGILTLHLDKEKYERAGLVGKPDGIKGKRGTKPRWVVEINLRLPSMLHGKKGFDRIVYAFKNVLTAPVTWLFHDLASTGMMPNPLDIHFPTRKEVSPEVSQTIKASIPPLKPSGDEDSIYDADFEDYAVELHEWISLILLDSPRVKVGDKIDPFLSRYALPVDSVASGGLVKLTWRGFIAPSWSHHTFGLILRHVPRESWFAYCVGGFADGWSGETRGSTILKLPDTPNEYVLWDVV